MGGEEITTPKHNFMASKQHYHCHKIDTMSLRIIILLFTCFPFYNMEAASIEFESEVANVTVYRSGVRITRNAVIKIPAGQSEITFSNLTTQINSHSLLAQVPEGLDLLTVHYKTNFIKNLELPESVKSINKEIEELRMALEWNNKQIAVYAQEEKILTPKQVELSSHDKGISVQELKDYTAYYRERSLEIKKMLFDLGNENKKINIQLAALQQELVSTQSRTNQKTGEVTFLIQSPIARECEISFSYISNQAGWVPVYDLKAIDTQSPLALNLKANVYQNTGIDWQDVSMTISTGNPLLGNDRPILRPNYITFAQAARSIITGSTLNLAYEMKKKDKPAITSDELELNNSVEISDTETTREYIINQVQTVASSGLKRMVELKRYDIEAKYKYHSVPKLDHGVFLLAEVANWGKYNLLPGTANLFFQNTYIGQSQINSQVTAKNILLSLGRDESIKIQRERTNYLEEKVFLGGNEIRNIEYTITIKNTKNKNASIEILDQFPISQHEDIKIELEHSTEAIVDEATGGLKWQLDLAPGSSKEVIFSYTQKYPRNKSLAGR